MLVFAPASREDDEGRAGGQQRGEHERAGGVHGSAPGLLRVGSLREAESQRADRLRTRRDPLS